MKKIISKIKNIFNINSFMKFIVLFIILHGIICISMSYVLAFMGRSDIAESLSQTVVQEITAPVIVYGFKSLFENISKYNNWVKIIKEDKYDKYSDVDHNSDNDISDTNSC